MHICATSAKHPSLCVRSFSTRKNLGHAASQKVDTKLSWRFVSLVYFLNNYFDKRYYYSPSIEFRDILSKFVIASKSKLSGQIVTDGNGTSSIAILLFSIFTTVRSDKNFPIVWIINKKKMVAETKRENIQKALKIKHATYVKIQNSNSRFMLSWLSTG